MTHIQRISYEVKEDKNKILDFFGAIFALKNTIRTGWVKYHGIKKERAESVADHTFSTAILAYLFAKEYRKDLDANRILKMVLFHEFEEVYIGDIPMRDFPDRKKTAQLERESVEKIFNKNYNKEELLELWQEFRDEKTPEAKFAKQFDKFEAVLQAYFYKKEGAGMVDYLSFIELSEEYFFDQEILDLIEELKNKK